jgi:hypothetical protein
MANDFKNASLVNVGTTFTDLYTAPALKKSFLVQLIVANVNASTGVQVDVQVVDASSSTNIHLVKNAPVPLGDSLQVISGDKICLEAGDKIRIKCSVLSGVDVFASLIEDV